MKPSIPEALLTPEPATCACVFVHGFNGAAVDSWSGFREAIFADHAKASNVDFYFFTYDSRDTPIVTSARILLDELQAILAGSEAFLSVSSGEALPPRSYDSLTLVGHSLGGVVIRRAITSLRHAAQESEIGPFESAVLGAAVRLFAPAQGGVLLSGWKGVFGGGKPLTLAARKWRTVAELTRPSQVLDQLEKHTLELASAEDPPGAARSMTIWAGDESVVESGYDYDHDPQSHVELGQSHSSVCKPTQAYELPTEFVATGWLE